MNHGPHPAEGGVDLDALSMTAPAVPPDACTNYETCGNVVPNNGEMCAKCLDRVRHVERSPP